MDVDPWVAILVDTRPRVGYYAGPSRGGLHRLRRGGGNLAGPFE